MTYCQLLTAALERAKEAGKKERAVCKLREQFGLLEQINSDLTYAVAVNLASVYQAAQLYTEALNSFTQIVRSKQFPQVFPFIWLQRSMHVLKFLLVTRAKHHLQPVRC